MGRRPGSFGALYRHTDDFEPKIALIVRVNISHNKANSTELSFRAGHRCGLSGLDDFFSRCTVGHSLWLWAMLLDSIA